MANLGGWDGAIQISGRALSDLAVALDQSVEPTVTASQATNYGGVVMVNCVELALNLELLVPRVLYASWNPNYQPDLGADPASLDELEELHARLNAHTALALLDPGNRLTFVRDQWLDGVENLPGIEFNPADAVANTVRIRLSGRVHIDSTFVDGATALNSPLRFEMSLDYRPGVRRSNILLPDQLDIGLGSLPFTTLAETWMVSSPPPGAEVWLPPGPDKPIWAGKVTNQEDDPMPDPCGDGTNSHWELTTRTILDDADDQFELQPELLFTGAPGECIVDPTTQVGRWTVEDVVEMPNGLWRVPRRLLVDTASMNQPVAESGKQHAGLIFDRISRFRIVDRPLEPAQFNAIQRSIMKLDGYAAGVWINPQLRIQVEDACRLLGGTNCNIPDPDAPTLALLALLGRHGMDFAPLPGELVAPIPNPSEQDENAFIDSDVIVLHEDATRVFTPTAADSGAIAFGGVLADRIDNAQRPPPDTSLPENLTKGQDLVVAVSENVIERQLRILLEPELRRKLRKKVPGFDTPSFRMDVDLDSDRIQLTISGSGEFLELFPFDFTVRFPIFLNVQPAILRDGEGKPLGVDGEVLPERRYVDDLDGSDGDIITPGFTPGLGCVGLYPPGDDFLATDPNLNPLCFLGYLDPRDPSLNVPGSLRLVGPWPLVNNETGCFPRNPAAPESSWTFDPAIPSAYRWREVHFTVPPFQSPPQDPSVGIAALRPGLAVSLTEPRKDDIEVDVDFSFLVDLFLGLINVPLLTPLSLVTLGAEAYSRHKVYRKGIKRKFPEISPVSIAQTVGWQIYLQHSDPLAPSNDAISIDGGGMYLRFRMIPGPDPSLGSWAPAVCAGLIP
jgi:hypothetical protein